MSRRSLGGLLLAMPVAVATACGGSGAGSTGPGTPLPSPTIQVPASPPVSPGTTPETAAILEDAGLEVELAPGTYTSRVFAPHITFELGSGWMRRDSTQERSFRLIATTEAWVLVVSEIDFAQCGATLLEHPDAAGTAALVAGATILSPALSTSAFGDRSAQIIDLPGTGASPGEAIDPANGCVLTGGDAPWPAEGGWIVLNPDMAAHLAVTDAGDETVVFNARSGRADLAAMITSVDPVLATTRFPESPPGD
jgi:hypothetical protein